MPAVRLLHASDIHHQLDWRGRSWASTGWRGAPGRFELHALGRLRRFASAAGAWHRILEDVDAVGAQHVFLTGDLTALGDEEELHAVHATLRPLLAARRLTVVPGNHDRYTDAAGARRFERVFAEAVASDFPEYADEAGYPFVRLLGDGAAVVGLDSTRVPGWGQYVAGRLGARQLRALAQLLDDARLARRTVHVLSHHGPWCPRGRHEWRESALVDGRALLRALRGRRVVLHHGHSHLRAWHRAHGERPHLFGGGSATEPGREGYWVVDVDDHRRLEGHHFLPGRRRCGHPRHELG